MKKLAFVLVFGLFVAFAFPVIAKSEKEKGPVDKATGEVWFETPYGDVWVNFNAHEGEDEETAKGWLYWERYTGYTNSWSGPVVYADVHDDVAEFKVRVEEGVIAGCDVTFEVYDMDEPASNGDSINIIGVVDSYDNTCAYDGQTQGPYSGEDFYGGNIQVHTYVELAE